MNVDIFELTVSSPENFQNGAEVVLSVGDLLDQDDDSSAGHSSDSSIAEPSERQVVHIPGSPSTLRTIVANSTYHHEFSDGYANTRGR